MENQPLEPLNQNDVELVEHTARLLDHRNIRNGPELWMYLCSLNLRELLYRRGVTKAKLNKKTFRTFRRKAARYIADFTSSDHALFPSMQTDISTRATIIHSFLLIFIERQVHRGVLSVKEGTPVRSVCTDKQCKLGCQFSLANSLEAQPASWRLRAEVASDSEWSSSASKWGQWDLKAKSSLP